MSVARGMLQTAGENKHCPLPPSLSIQDNLRRQHLWSAVQFQICVIASLSDFKVRSKIIHDVTVGHGLMSGEKTCWGGGGVLPLWPEAKILKGNL